MTTSGGSYPNDLPTTKDALNFSDFISGLYEILMKADTPLTVGVFGRWGSGKTSLMQMLREKIEEKALHSVATIWINAWKYDRQEALWRSFILRVLDVLYPREDGEGPREERERLPDDKLSKEQNELVTLLGRLEESVYRPVDWQEVGKLTVNLLQTAKEGAQIGLEVAIALLIPFADSVKKFNALIGKILAKDNADENTRALSRQIKTLHREQLASMEQFEATFQEALNASLKEKGNLKNGRLIVFVDDLDRCLPEKTIEVLEAIKLFLGAKGVVFVLALDREVIERGIEVRYASLLRKGEEGKVHQGLPINGEEYLQKIIQIPFFLPPLEEGDIGNLIDECCKSLEGGNQPDKVTRAILANGLLPNPRQAKRVINSFTLLRQIAASRQERQRKKGQTVMDISLPLLAKTVLIQAQWQELYADWRLYPTLVRTLEEEYERRPSSEEEQILKGEEFETAQTAEVKTEGASSIRVVKDAGGSELLKPYLTKRRTYALLEKMLRYPPQGTEPQGVKVRFTGLSRAEMAQYISLAGAVTEAAPAAAEELEFGVGMADLLGGDMAKITDFLEAEMANLSPEARGKKEEGLQRRLLPVLNDPRRPAPERVGAGNSLAVLGDPRFDPNTFFLPRENPEDLLGFVEIPAGKFLMGSDDITDAEKPRHEVALPAYYMARYPVTAAQFRAFVKDKKYEPANPDYLKGLPNHPVASVTWYDALAYCEWLTEKLKTWQKIPRLLKERLALGWQVTLPSEAEWEKAARGTDGRIYPWGNEFDTNKANTEETGIGGTSAVGCFPGGASPYGMFDMSGNVWQWTRSLWGKKSGNPDFMYPYDPADKKRENLAAGKEVYRIVRGGSFFDGQGSVRCARRFRNNPNDWSWLSGFRLVLSPFNASGSLAL